MFLLHCSPGQGAKQEARANSYTLDDLRRLKALVVDDNQTAGEVFPAYLENMRLAVDTVNDGVAARKKPRDSSAEEPFDVVTTDS